MIFVTSSDIVVNNLKIESHKITNQDGADIFRSYLQLYTEGWADFRLQNVDNLVSVFVSVHVLNSS